MLAPMVREAQDIAAREIAMCAPMVREAQDIAAREIAMCAPMVRGAQDIAAREIAMCAPMVREAVKLKQDLAMWHQRKETRMSAFGSGVYLPPMRAPTQAINNEVQLPTRRRIGFSPWREDR